MTGPMAGITRVLARTPEGLKGRDPEFIRGMLPRLWLAAQLYFRAEVNGFENVPDEPVLFVGNHSGGANIPGTFVFALGYNTYFTVEGRPLVGLAHEMVVRMPVIGDMARKFGMAARTMLPKCCAGPGTSSGKSRKRFRSLTDIPQDYLTPRVRTQSENYARPVSPTSQSRRDR